MADDLSLFVALAEIAGVFVGFGALIGVARRAEIDRDQLGQIRAVVTVGLVVVVAALLPVGLARYRLADPALWRVSSLLFLALNWAAIILSLRRPENRALTVAQARTSPLQAAFFWILLEVPIQVPLALGVLGVRPDLVPAFYTTALLFSLFEAAAVLARLVYSQAEG